MTAKRIVITPKSCKYLPTGLLQTYHIGHHCLKNIVFRKRLKRTRNWKLEILSSYFILETLPKAKITCVDTWAGAPELSNGEILSERHFENIDNKFDRNLLPFKNRVTKYKGSSFSFFNQISPKVFYDFIYIDGSHRFEDVIIDAIKGFEMLKTGGIMIFDDYRYIYPKALDNPAAAINVFLRINASKVSIIQFHRQLAIEKLSN